jgi:hypothetical protein
MAGSAGATDATDTANAADATKAADADATVTDSIFRQNSTLLAESRVRLGWEQNDGVQAARLASVEKLDEADGAWDLF